MKHSIAPLLIALLAGCVGVSSGRDSGAPAGESAGPGYGTVDSSEGRAGGMVAMSAKLDDAAGLADNASAARSNEGPGATDRLVVRTGGLTLRTSNPDEVGTRAVEAVKAAGGYVASRDNASYVFRIPAAKFEEIFAAIERMGAVVSRRVDAHDVTDEVRDVELRLRNARALRDRYDELLKRAEKIEDVLAIERELAKVTEVIEQLEGQLKTRNDEVAMSLLTLDLQPVASSRALATSSPFPWLGKIGVERLPQYRSDRASSSRVKWELPEGFADMGRISDSDIEAWAYSPDGIRVVVRRFDHKPVAAADFWRQELTRELQKARGYEPDGDPLRFRTLVDGQPTTYAIRLIRTERYLTVVEVMGPTDIVASRWADLSALMDRIESVAR